MIERERKGKGTGTLSLEFISDRDDVPVPPSHPRPTWWDRPSPEAPLGFNWLAQTLYPEEMQSVDLKQETQDFYRTFYDYELSEEEYNKFFFQ
ncbi:hypothetical protein NVS47_13695 [Dehalobacterium formicoaceticum]|uniref:Uncharacterized protein n=1 Tax=Dehalobacterium formicoaceticum TaxID=51515 RepID=A0ABT1YA70_9FIRM|nr:hypothetical protein [Dehalobacterium formicoaceticum]MCR6546551.1 hypothetical protein [Dehalobacterium formicoaceticum]